MRDLNIGDVVKVVKIVDDAEFHYTKNSGKVCNISEIMKMKWMIINIGDEEYDGEPCIGCRPEDGSGVNLICFYREELELANTIRRVEI